MIYEVEMRLTCFVSIEDGGEASAREVARDKVANGPCLFVAEGAALKAGHYTVKGMSAEVVEARPFVGNRRIGSAEAEGED